ncbi:MAG TPA: transcription antitermination factor NusB [Gammaproteobacteria bacterium]|nr:transcription antitermination factor NusB [Gammaproteobacteria bacterium]
MSTIKQRKMARELLMKTLYEWGVSDQVAAAMIAEVKSRYSEETYDLDYFVDGMEYISEHVEELDQLYVPHSHGQDENGLTPIEQAILRLACYELKARIDIPPKVIINEAVELAKRYGAQDGYKFVNGVVESVAKSLGKSLS